MEEITKGKWYLPLYKKYGKGRIIKDKDKLILQIDIYSKKRLNSDLNMIPLIGGKLVSGEETTLINCKEIHKQEVFGSNVIQLEIFIGTYIKGLKFSKLNDIKISEANIYFDHFDVWVNNSGFVIEHKKDDEYFIDIKHKLPEEIKINLDKNTQFIISSKVSGPSHPIISKVFIEQKSFIRLIFKKKISYASLLEYRTKIQWFLSLATRRPVYPIETEIVKKIKIADKLIPKKYPFMESYNNKDKRIIHTFELLFNYREISPDLENILIKWFDLNRKLKFPIQGHFSLTYNSKSYLEHNFLQRINSIEGFHRQIFDSFYVKTKEYNIIKQELNNAIPLNLNKSFKQALKSRINFGNEYSLRKRLDQIYKEYCKVLSLDYKKIKKEINPIVDTRNYLVHQDKNSKENILSNQTILLANYRLKEITIYLILNEIIENKKMLKKIMTRHQPPFLKKSII